MNTTKIKTLKNPWFFVPQELSILKVFEHSFALRRQMNKRGQFFLIAAIVIIGLIIGLTSVSNSARVGDENEAFYDLAEEIGFETKQVLDYGVYNAKDTENLTKEFLVDYADYIAQEQVIFIYGNETDLIGLFFNLTATGSVGIQTGRIPGTILIQQRTKQTAEVTREGNLVSVKINEIPYEFNLKQGRNFFFVIIKGQNEEKFVAAQ